MAAEEYHDMSQLDEQLKEDEETALCHFLIELAFALPHGIDLNKHPLLESLKTYIEKVRVRARSETPET